MNIKLTDVPIEAVWMRGGTSTGLFVRADQLPRDYDERVKLLARLVSRPNPEPAGPPTAKVAVLSRSRRFRHDIDFWFGQVDMATGLIDSRSSCEQLLAAVGPAAVWLKLIEPQSERAALRIWQVNLGHTFESRFALREGHPAETESRLASGESIPCTGVELAVFAPEGTTQQSDDEDDKPQPTRRSATARRLKQGLADST